MSKPTEEEAFAQGVAASRIRLGEAGVGKLEIVSENAKGRSMEERPLSLVTPASAVLPGM